MVQTVRPLSEVLTLLADNNSGAISPEDVRDAIISTYVNTSPLWTDVEHVQGQLVRRPDGNVYQANAAIPAGTGFTEGATGATWTRVIDANAASGLTPNTIPFVSSSNEFVSSDMRVMTDRTVMIPDDSRAGPLGIGPLTSIMDVNSFIRVGNDQFPDVVFDLVDGRSRTTAESNRPRQFYLTEARNAFEINPTGTEQITTNPLNIDYTVQLDAETSGIMFNVFEAMTNVRVTVRYNQGDNEIIRYLPTTEAVISGTGGYDFVVGDNTIDFWPERAFRLFTNDQIRITVEADNVAFMGLGGVPRAQFQVQRGEFRDLAWLSDLSTAPTAALSGFRININPTVPTDTDLNTARNVTFTIANAADFTALSLIVTDGTDQTLTVPSSDGTHTQSVTLAGIDTSSAGTITFQLSGTTSGGTSVTSNMQTVTVRVIAPEEQAYFGVRETDDFATVATSELTAVDVQPPGTRFEVNVSLPATHILGILEPTDRPITSILEQTFGVESLSSFTRTENARSINGQTYDLLTLTNNGPTGNISFEVTHG